MLVEEEYLKWWDAKLLPSIQGMLSLAAKRAWQGFKPGFLWRKCQTRKPFRILCLLMLLQKIVKNILRDPVKRTYSHVSDIFVVSVMLCTAHLQQ